jgi:hypothetical protein
MAVGLKAVATESGAGLSGLFAYIKMFPSPIPELVELDQQMMVAVDPTQRPQLEKALVDAKAFLETTDKTNLNQYAGAMQQVVIIKRRLESNVTHQDLLTKRIEILESLI